MSAASAEITRQPPPEAEEALIGCLMLDADGSAWAQIAGEVDSEDFTDSRMRSAYVAVAASRAEGLATDPLALSEYLQRGGGLDDAGGMHWLGDIARRTPTASSALTYAKILRGKRDKRDLRAIGEDLARGDLSRPPAAIIEKAQSDLAKISTRRNAAKPSGPARTPLDWLSLNERSPAVRDWAMLYWLAMAQPSLLSGVGGIGKTLLAQIIATCMALGRNYIDVIEKPRRVLFWGGEDELDEFWRRQIPICSWLGVPLTALQDNLIIESYFGRDITLAAHVYGSLSPTRMMDELRAQIGDYRADYVFLDSVARIYGGSENDRAQVTQFITWLTGVCAPTGAGFCLLGHPGKANGAEYSGSTAWEGSVRSRLYLASRLPDDDRSDDYDESLTDETVRYLSRRKANYSSKDWRKLNYVEGVLVPEEAPPPRFGSAGGEFAQDIVLRAVRRLADLKIFGNGSTRSPEYLPRLAKQYELLDSLSEKQFAKHMRDLIVAKRIEPRTVGQYSNRTPKLGLVEVLP